MYAELTRSLHLCSHGEQMAVVAENSQIRMIY